MMGAKRSAASAAEGLVKDVPVPEASESIELRCHAPRATAIASGSQCDARNGRNGYKWEVRIGGSAEAYTANVGEQIVAIPCKESQKD